MSVNEKIEVEGIHSLKIPLIKAPPLVQDAFWYGQDDRT